MKHVTREMFDKVKAQPHKSQAKIAEEFGISRATISRIRRSVHLSEVGSIDNKKPSIVRRTENKKSVITTTIKGGKATVSIEPKLSLWQKICERFWR